MFEDFKMRKKLLILLLAVSPSLWADSVSDCLHGRIRNGDCLKMLNNYYKHNHLIEQTAVRHGIPVSLFVSQVAYESGYNQYAVSKVGARGLTQVMRGTAPELGVSYNHLYHPETSLYAGAKYLRRQYDRFGRWDLALAAFNAGPGRVKQAGNRVPNILETKLYVANILKLEKAFREKQQKDQAALKKVSNTQPAALKPITASPSVAASGTGKVFYEAGRSKSFVPPMKPDRTNRTLPVMTTQGWIQGETIKVDPLPVKKQYVKAAKKNAVKKVAAANHSGRNSRFETAQRPSRFAMN